MSLTNRLALLYKDNPLNLKLLKRFILTFLAITVLTFIGFVVFHPDLKPIIAMLDETFNSKPFGNSKFGNFIKIVINNCIEVPLQSLVIAMIPIPFLYFINSAMTGFSIGFIYYLPLVFKKITFFMIFVGTIVHGIPEIIGFCITCVALFPINQAICHKIYKRQKNVHFKAVVISSCKIYLIYALPVLIFAALIEAFITPLFLTLI